jgi:hypothetical protein
VCPGTEPGAKAGGDTVTYQISGQKGGKTYAVAINNDGMTNVPIMARNSPRRAGPHTGG